MMDRDTLFLTLQAKEIETAHNSGDKESPSVVVTCKDGEKYSLEKGFLEKYKVCLSVVKGKPQKWYVEER